MIEIPIAVAAGLVSFFSPCVLPLVPGYLSFVTGVSLTELEHDGRRHGTDILWGSLAFIAGFSVLFIAFGASASLIGQLLFAYRSIVRVVAGLLIIAFGIFVAGPVQLPFLSRLSGMRAPITVPGRLGAFALGTSFAVAWTPCVGPILTSILLLAGNAQTVGKGALLLTAYSLGLGIPFVATALFMDRSLRAFAWVKRHYSLISAASGVLLILMGILVLTDRMSAINATLQRFFLSGQ